MILALGLFMSGSNTFTWITQTEASYAMHYICIYVCITFKRIQLNTNYSIPSFYMWCF